MTVKDWIIDFETLGEAPDGVVIDMSVVVFENDPNNIPSFDELVKSGKRFKFSTAKQRIDGETPRILDKGVIEWWKKQTPAAKLNLRPSNEDLSLSEALEGFYAFLQENGVKASSAQAWARGIVFDLPILIDIIRQVKGERNMHYLLPSKHWNHRDIRTAIESTLMVRGMTECPLPYGTLDGFIAHDSIHDAARDVLMLLYAKRYALGLDEPPEDDYADPNSVKKPRGD